MKKVLILLAMLVTVMSFNAQEDKEGVMEACEGYFRAFYQGDLQAVDTYFSRTLYKVGYWKGEDGNYSDPKLMSYDDVVSFAKRVLSEQDFAQKDATKEIEILDVAEKIATVKVKGTWGFDYINLRKDENNWKIEQVIWQGPN